MHCSRIRRYADSLVGTPAAMRQVAERTDRLRFSVDTVKDIRFRKDKREILISLMGLKASWDTWEPFDIIYEDVNIAVRSFLLSQRHTDSIREARAQIGV